jgi:hypothetical protein
VIRLVSSDALRAEEVAALRQLFDEAWSDDAEGFPTGTGATRSEGCT